MGMSIGAVGDAAALPAADATNAPSATTSGTASTTGATSTDSSRMASQLSTPNLFIKLLMAELEHEDPTNPTTPSSILQQTAELSQVESITTMTTALDQQSRYGEANDATGLIGKQVTALVTGRTVSGTVSQVSLSTTGVPTLEIAGTNVPLSAVTDVTAVAPATPAATTTGQTTTT
jgi:flagellar basal-body rod modification protein FlgD